MLDFAVKYKDELNRLWINTINNDKYKYFHNSSYEDFEINLSNDTWSSLQIVSVKNGKVIGYFKARIDRDTRNITYLAIMNFYDVNYIFAKDFRTFLIDLFDKYKYNKVSFSVVKGNPIEKMYDKYIKQYGGRIVGTKIDETRLYDGEFYDEKLYEITRKEYLITKINEIK